MQEEALDRLANALKNMIHLNQSEQVGELFAALSKAQLNMQRAKKGAVNPFFNSKYSDLAAIASACVEALNNESLAVTQTIAYEEGKVFLITTLGHSSGQWIKSKMLVPEKKDDPNEKKKGRSEMQELGSNISYARRYALASIAGVYPEGDDDDGEKAAEKERKLSEEEARLCEEKLGYIRTELDKVGYKTDKAAIHAFIVSRANEKQASFMSVLQFATSSEKNLERFIEAFKGRLEKTDNQ